MADPLALPAACAVGLCAVFAAAIGIEPQTLVYSTVGAIFGTATAPPSGRVRAMFLFLAVALGAALLGTWAAEYWHSGARIPRNAWAMGLGASFHLIVANTLKAVPSILSVVAQVIKAKGGQ